jgi:phospholipase/lecithinase/hemolysin
MPCLDIETVEAEVVFLIRCAGQWPQYQTEIHFHPSTAVHRDIAASIIARYALRPNPAVNPDAPQAARRLP